MSFNFGSSTKKEGGTQTLLLPQATAGEQELTGLNVQLAKQQLQAMQQAASQEQARQDDPLTQLQRQVEEKATQNILARLTGQSPVLAPEEEARLNTIYQAAQQQAEQDLTRYATQIAGQRGMRVSDSPIGNEVIRQRGQVGTQLAGQKAASALNLGQAGADFNARLAQFTQGLQQQAFMNRLALGSTSPASFGLQQQLFGQRLAAAPRSFTGTTGLSQYGYGLDVGSLASGLGGAARGYSSLG